MKFKRSNKAGFTLIEIFVVVTIIGLLAAIAFSNFVIARDNSRLTVITTNLREIESAKEQWAIDNKKGTGAPVDNLNDLKPYLRRELANVVDEIYEANAIGTPATASLPVKLGSYPAGSQIAAP
ncbi:MAG: prepilin-type N-terminal cleavage/methylation domain-containing protein [Verrucomicrobia bacterium]|nr:prepilin-type N-terminal cleavage/methylation domain-containing protein [Verrucomicrobiota bacterium]